MDLMKNISSKFNETTQSVAKSSKELAETAKLNAQISDMRKQTENLYPQIGKLFYSAHEFDPETEIGKLCAAAEDLNEQITKCERNIKHLKGIKSCHTCGADVPIASAFCGTCGARVEAEEDAEIKNTKLCSGCGAVLAEGVFFCTSCGKKVE